MTWFLVGALGLAVFEAVRVYLIMPMPGSQRLSTADIAHVLHTGRWAFRVVCAGMVLTGLAPAWRGAAWRKGVVWLALVVAAGVSVLANTMMSADRMFRQPEHLRMAPAAANTVEGARLVIGVVLNGEARAYPIRFIGYHHQVRDMVGGEPIMATYCTVCRTGRVYSPRIGTWVETFRLVGMDHFNALFEDRGTRSWWRQATGEAIVGPRKGMHLAELPSVQVPLERWLALHPNSLVMQEDPACSDRYARSFDYESGASRGVLTGTDPDSWRDKSWVVGLTVGGASRAYDWNRLKRERVVNDVVGGVPIVLALTSDTLGFFAFQRPDTLTRFEIRGDTLVAGRNRVPLDGAGATAALLPIQASQEFWHSWRAFHPETSRY